MSWVMATSIAPNIRKTRATPMPTRPSAQIASRRDVLTTTTAVAAAITKAMIQASGGTGETAFEIEGDA